MQIEILRRYLLKMADVSANRHDEEALQNKYRALLYALAAILIILVDCLQSVLIERAK